MAPNTLCHRLSDIRHYKNNPLQWGYGWTCRLFIHHSFKEPIYFRDVVGYNCGQDVITIFLLEHKILACLHLGNFHDQVDFGRTFPIICPDGGHKNILRQRVVDNKVQRLRVQFFRVGVQWRRPGSQSIEDAWCIGIAQYQLRREMDCHDICMLKGS